MEIYIEKRTEPITHLHSLKCFGDSVKTTQEEMLALFGKPITPTNKAMAKTYPLMQIVEDMGDYLKQAPFELKIQKGRNILIIFTTTSEHSWRIRETIKNMVKEYRENKITKIFN